MFHFSIIKLHNFKISKISKISKLTFISVIIFIWKRKCQITQKSLKNSKKEREKNCVIVDKHLKKRKQNNLIKH